MCNGDRTARSGAGRVKHPRYSRGAADIKHRSTAHVIPPWFSPRSVGIDDIRSKWQLACRSLGGALANLAWAILARACAKYARLNGGGVRAQGGKVLRERYSSSISGFSSCDCCNLQHQKHRHPGAKGQPTPRNPRHANAGTASIAFTVAHPVPLRVIVFLRYIFFIGGILPRHQSVLAV